MNNKMTGNEITRLLNILIGSVCPVADANIDIEINNNLMTMIDVMNLELGYIYDCACHRKSPYGSARNIGERAYAALLEWKKWIEDIEEELA